jgi:hypothetical protein
VKDHQPLKSGHRTRFWYSQDSTQCKKATPSQKPGVTHCDNIGMEHFACHSQLNVGGQAADQPGYWKITILLNHQSHKPYYDVTMLPKAIVLI